MDRLADVELEVLRKAFPVGRRVRFLGFGQPEPTALPAGAEGSVSFVDRTGVVHVDWDTGVSLGMIVRPARRQCTDRILPLGDGPSWLPG